MSVQDNTEKVLRKLHVLIARAEVYSEDQRYVLVEKREIQKLFSDLNGCLVDLMEEYQLNKESRMDSERAIRRQSEEIIAESKSKAEDVYAASVLYSNEALSEVWKMIHASTQSIEQIYTNLEKNLVAQERRVRKNQSELRSHLRNLEDTDKYMRLIEQENYRMEADQRERERMQRDEELLKKNAEPKVVVNEEVLKKIGMEPVEIIKPLEEANSVNEVIIPADEDKKELPKLDKETVTAVAEEEIPVIGEKPEDLPDLNIDGLFEESEEGSGAEGETVQWDDILGSNSRMLDNTETVDNDSEDDDLVTIDLEASQEKKEEVREKKKGIFSFHKK